MKKIEVKLQDKSYCVDIFSTAKDVLKQAGLIDSDSVKYLDNPIVGVLINGVLSALETPIAMSCTIKPIKVFQGFGRRIYRHSICFLLSYTSYLLYPNRRLVIGHSLGDGFYFNYEDNLPVLDEQIQALVSKMQELVDRSLDIEYVTLSTQDAIAKLNNQGFFDAVTLLKTRNNASVCMYKIQNYYNVAYEPIVSNTSVMSLWKLSKYGPSGLLLRYPVRDSRTEIIPPKNHDRLFEVFNEYRTWGKILGVSNVGEMNYRYLDNSAEQYVRLAEALQRRKIASIADTVKERKAKAVFIAGPSSSGKTTFAKKLCEQFLLLGFSPIRISLDDYYKKRQDVPLGEDGKPDFEVLEALNLELFDQNMKDLFSYKDVDLPHFSFKKNDTYYLNQPIRLEGNTIFVIEGLHGLNPRITSMIEAKYVFKVYISALTQLNMDDSNRVSTTDDRMLRRILRDHRTRATSAQETLLMWPSVSRGERVHIFPNQNNADVMFNSALDYELGVLSPFVVPLLHEVSPDSGDAYTHAQRLLAFLENIYPIPSYYVPSDSILREFIGDSDYED